MGEKKCYKCFTLYAPDSKSFITCDLCSHVTCKPCTDLCPTEMRVVDLQQRNLIYACPECRTQSRGMKKTQATEECSDIIKELGNLLRKSMEDLEKKILKLDKDKTQQITNLQKVLEQKNKDQNEFIEWKIKSMMTHYEGSPKRSVEETRQTIPESTAPKTKGNFQIKQKRPPLVSTTKTPQLNNSKTKKAEDQQRKIMEEIIYLNSDNLLTQDAVEEIISSESTENKHRKIVNIRNVSKPKPTQVQQLDQHEKDKEYIEVRRKREWRQDKIGTNDGEIQRSFLQSHRRQLKNKGTAEDDFNKNDENEKESRKIWMFISRAKNHITEEKLLDYISNKTNMKKETIHIKKVETWYKKKNNNCFLVGVDPSLKELVYTPEFWPKGLMYSRFDFRKGQQFLDNPRKTEINQEQEDASDF